MKKAGASGNLESRTQLGSSTPQRYHLKDLNKVAESVPQNPSREDLEAILWKGWPELRDFERESINRGAKTQKRRRAALDEEDEVQ